MDQARMQRRGRRKRAALAVAIVALLALAGTFAWANYTQVALNEARGVSAQPGGRLHDDFTFKTAATSNKDVYVENFLAEEDGGGDIYARVRFLEYLETGPNAGLDVSNGAKSVAKTGVGGTEPDREKRGTWTLHYFNAADNPDEGNPGPGSDLNEGEADIHDYFEWVYGSEADGSTVYMPTFNKNRDSYEADVNGSYRDEPEPYDKYRKYVKDETVKSDASYDADANTVDEAYGDPANDTLYMTDGSGRKLGGTGGKRSVDGSEGAFYIVEGEEHTATATATTAKVISMAEWKAMKDDVDGAGETYEKEDLTGPFWIYDADGWAYWAQPIKPGKASGLLLTNIKPKEALVDDWYYGIEAQAQFVSMGEWGDGRFASTDTGHENADNSMTEDAGSLLEEAKEKDSRYDEENSDIYALTLSPASVALDAGTTQQFKATTTKNGQPDTDTYTWSVEGPGSFEPESPTGDTANLKVEEGAYGEELTVKVTGTASKMTSSAKVTVNAAPESEAPTVPGVSDIESAQPNPSSPPEVRLDTTGDGNPDTAFLVLAKKTLTKGEDITDDAHETGEYALVLSKGVLNRGSFGNNSKWSDSTVKSWCNNTYYGGTITGGVKDLIPQVRIYTQSAFNQTTMTETQDYVFYLSAADVFGKRSNNTAWSDAKGDGDSQYYTTGEVKQLLSNASAEQIWWLRSPGYGNNSGVAYASSDGILGSHARNASAYARPAFWVYLGSD